MDMRNEGTPLIPVKEEAPKEQPPGMALTPLLLALGCAWLFVRGVLFGGPGISMLVSALAFLSVALWYRGRAGLPLRTACPAQLLLILLLALSSALFESAGAKPLLVLCQLAMVPYWLYAAFGRRSGQDAFAALPVDALRAAVEIPLRHAGQALRGLGRAGAKRTLWWVLAGIALSIPLLLIATSLLAEADARFGALVEAVLDRFSVDLGAIVARGALTLLLGWYLAALLYGMRQDKGPARALPAPPQLPVPMTAVVLVALSALYIVFCAVQVGSVREVLVNAPRYAFFYSGYARRGFFELCAIAVINLCVYGATHALTREKPLITRILLTLLGILTLLLILLAGLKMGLYIERYGLTLLRVYTMGFIGLLFVIFCLLIARAWRKFRLPRAIVLACVTAVLALAFLNLPGQVARLNANRYLAGTLPHFDMEQYAQFPYESAPHLIRLYSETENATLQAEIERHMEGINTRTKNTPAYGKSVQRLITERRAALFLAETSAP